MHISMTVIINKQLYYSSLFYRHFGNYVLVKGYTYSLDNHNKQAISVWFILIRFPGKQQKLSQARGHE